MEDRSGKQLVDGRASWEHEANYLLGVIKDLDQLALIVSQDLGVDRVVVSILQDEILHTVGMFPSPGLSFSGREQVLGESICSYTMKKGGLLEVVDARKDPELCLKRSVVAGEIVGYLGVPIITRDAEVVGAVGCATTNPRRWSVFERKYLEQIARNTELILFRGRSDLEINELITDLSDMDQIISALSSQAKMPISIYKPGGELVFVNAELTQHVPIELVADYWVSHSDSLAVRLKERSATTLSNHVFATTKVNVPGQGTSYSVSIAISKSGLVVCTWFQGPKPVSPV